jgi:hypothetical protein
VQRVVDRLDEKQLARRHGRRGHAWTRRSSSRIARELRRRLGVRMREDELAVAGGSLSAASIAARIVARDSFRTVATAASSSRPSRRR